MAADVKTFLKEWRAAVDSGDHARIYGLLGDKITFSSPVVYKPSSDRVYIEHVLGFVAASLNDFRYVDEYEQPGGAALVFQGTVNGLNIEGIDLFKLDDAGKVRELKVMMRPLNAVMVLAETMKARFAAMGAS